MSSADSSTALPDNAVSSTAPPETEIKPPAPQTKRLADEEDDPVGDSEPSSSTPASESIVENLKIDEKKINKFLDEPEDSNIKAVTTGETPYTSASRFEDLNLSSDLLKGLYVEMKFEKPSKIQAISLPMILTPPYKGLIAKADKGSGKTTCLVLGMLSRVDPNLKAPQALCICPTRELAIQNMEVLRKMGKHTGITSECAVPMDITNSISINKRVPVSAQIVIGTPGTIKRWMSAKRLAVNHVKILLFDEADHMLADDGFKDDSLRIKKDIERSSRHCQVLLFSATFNETVDNFVAKIGKDYNRLSVKDNKRERAFVIEKIKKAHSTALEETKRVDSTKLEEAGRALHIEHEKIWKLHSTKIAEARRAHPIKLEEIRRVHSTKRTHSTEHELELELEEARRAHSAEIEEIKIGYSTEYEDARRAHFKKVQEAKRVQFMKVEEAERAHFIILQEIRNFYST